MRNKAIYASFCLLFLGVLVSACSGPNFGRLESNPQFKALTPDRQKAVKCFIPSPGYSQTEVKLALGRPDKVYGPDGGSRWKYFNYQGIMPPMAIDPRYSKGDNYVLVLTFERDMVIKAEIETTRDAGDKFREENHRWSEKR